MRLKTQQSSKVIEGVTKQRNIRRKQTPAVAREDHGPSERIPPDDDAFPVTDPVERQLFAPCFGKKFTKVMEDMRETVRNAVAHLDPEGDSLVADDFNDIERCENAAPVLKYIAREMLRHEVEAQAAEIKAKPAG